MSHLLKLAFTFLVFWVLINTNADAQDLEYLAPVINAKINKDTGTSLMVGTIDYARFERRIEKKPYVNSVQIINAAQPWPPVWYMATPVYSDELFAQDTISHHLRFVHIGYPQVDSGNLSYLNLGPYADADSNKLHREQFEYLYIELDKHLNPIDTLSNRILSGGAYKPGFRSNPRIKQLTVFRQDTLLNLSSLSGDMRDSAVESDIWVLQVLDNNNNVKLEWNPLFHFDPKLYNLKEQLANHKPGDKEGIRWTKLNDACWDYDGNIIYSFEKSVGKISQTDGRLLWHFDCSDMFIITGLDTFKCYSPIGFKFLGDNDTSSYYSFYERGTDRLSLAKGVVLEQNKKTLNLKVIRYILPNRKYQSLGHSGFHYDYLTGDYDIDYGVFEDPNNKDDFWKTFEYGKDDSAYAVYQLPKWNYSFGLWRLQNWPLPPRPIIEKKGDLLVAVGEMKEYTWYKLEGVNNVTITKVGTGPNIKPLKNATYCVAARYGMGYSVSQPFDTKRNSTY